jgi:single-strand DNA-binding protein
MAVVSGRLQIRKWKDKDGNDRKSAEVVADNVYFGDSKTDSSSGSSYSTPAFGSYAAPAPAPAHTDYSANNFDMLEDEDSQLPF